MSKPLFIVDSMLGTLAKWLRILGFDTLYFRSIDDNELIRISKQQQRILITRDSRLIKSKKIGRHIFIHSEDLEKQLNEVLSFLSSETFSFNFFSRCIKCNGILMKVEKNSIFNVVPEYIYRNNESFFRCSKCGKVYWEGSHIDMIEKKIQEIRRFIERNNIGSS
jgi:uncharacterized protein with PIN domain